MKRQQSVSAPTNFAVYPKTAFGQKWYNFSQWVATYQLQIFWLTLYTLVLVGVFLERAFCKFFLCFAISIISLYKVKNNNENYNDVLSP